MRKFEPNSSVTLSLVNVTIKKIPIFYFIFFSFFLPLFSTIEEFWVFVFFFFRKFERNARFRVLRAILFESRVVSMRGVEFQNETAETWLMETLEKRIKLGHYKTRLRLERMMEYRIADH